MPSRLDQTALSAKSVYWDRLLNPNATPLLLDGALGTELERRGLRSELPLWSTHALLEAPEVVYEIHREYLAAGAELLTANTFRTQRRTLRRCNLDARARELTALAISLARDAVREHLATQGASERMGAAQGASVSAKTYLVLGSNPPLEDCYRPDLVPDEKTLAREHRENIETLLDAGADAVLIETMNCIREAVAAVKAARELGATALVSFCATASGTLLSGEVLANAIAAVRPYAPSAVLVNCLPPSAVRACLTTLASAKIPFGVYANNLAIHAASAGAQAEENDFLSPSAYTDEARTWLSAGARIVGGCCGTTPTHIEKLAALLAGIKIL